MGKLLKHTVQNIPFYKELQFSLGDNPYHDIKKFPIIYKKVIKENIDKMYIGDKDKMVIEKKQWILGGAGRGVHDERGELCFTSYSILYMGMVRL
jgi:hypothetical protein